MPLVHTQLNAEIITIATCQVRAIGRSVIAKPCWIACRMKTLSIQRKETQYPA